MDKLQEDWLGLLVVFASWASLLGMWFALAWADSDSEGDD